MSVILTLFYSLCSLTPCTAPVGNGRVKPSAQCNGDQLGSAPCMSLRVLEARHSTSPTKNDSTNQSFPYPHSNTTVYLYEIKFNNLDLSFLQHFAPINVQRLIQQLLNVHSSMPVHNSGGVAGLANRVCFYFAFSCILPLAIAHASLVSFKWFEIKN